MQFRYALFSFVPSVIIIEMAENLFKNPEVSLTTAAETRSDCSHPSDWENLNENNPHAMLFDYRRTDIEHLRLTVENVKNFEAAMEGNTIDAMRFDAYLSSQRRQVIETYGESKLYPNVQSTNHNESRGDANKATQTTVPMELDNFFATPGRTQFQKVDSDSSSIYVEDVHFFPVAMEDGTFARK